MKFATLAWLTTCCLTSATVTEQSVVHAGATFRVVKLAPDRISLVWKDPHGTPYRNFETVQAAFEKQGKTVAFLMNAGIFEPGGIPSGLHVEHGKTLHPLNLADAPGNFFLKPNGVFSIRTGDRPAASITTSDAFRQTAPPAVLAVQSGPMLLIGGKRHPAFNAGSNSKLHRNGVGVDRDGRVVFAITAPGETVNFWNFAGLFLSLGCDNALFLDGDISQMTVNPAAPVQSNSFGAMFVVSE